jgi:hypothetical protein
MRPAPVKEESKNINPIINFPDPELDAMIKIINEAEKSYWKMEQSHTKFLYNQK